MQFIFPCFLCQYTDETLTQRKVYASADSAKRTEFYQADANGHKIDKVMTVRTFEYGGENILKQEEDTYIILRSYDKKNGTIELSLINETRLYDEEATLSWSILESGAITEKSQPVKVRNNSITSQTFYASIQAGTNIIYSFSMKASEFELTKRIDTDTNKPLYATKINFQGATYEIIQTFRKKDLNEIEMICT